MEILQLRYFCDAAYTQNFSKTAKKFGVPPSNISQCIKRLEKELGTKLFSRSSNSLQLNEQGAAFYEKISQVLAMIDEAQAEVGNVEFHTEIKICITANRRIVMQTIEKYSMENPNARFVVNNKYDKSEDYDIIIADDLFDSKGMDKKLIVSEDISLAMRKDNSLAKNKSLVIEDIKKENFISLNPESSLFAVTAHFCRNHGFTTNIAIQCDDPSFVRKCVELGLGVAFAPVFSWKGMFSDDVVIKPVEGFVRNTYAYRKRSRYLTKNIKDFLELLVDECKNETTNSDV